MELHHGFELLREETVDELQARARLYRHAKTGAEMLSLSLPDENKVFGITFRTPPSDHTGVAHILEHSVLCGSRKYPSKEPFVELLKGSLQTFLNAFTFPDKTCYPVASQHLQDFYNLIEVYLDAVFHPLLTEATHQQEGWHYELDTPDAPLTFKGVVFNEMKGVYSSPDSCLLEYAQRSLFPDTTYGLDSGGDPEHIPDLTWQGLRDFHFRFYHPSNARIFFHGDDPEEARLEKMDAWLSTFDRRDVTSAVPLQPLFPAPRRVERAYAAGPDGAAAKNFVALNWLLGPATDADRALLLQLLAHILIGTPASPLRKALIDSGLGDDLCGTGMEPHAQQQYFSTGLRGVDEASLDKVEPLILGTLERLATEGVDPRTVEASLNTIEFALRENNSGSYPRGLAVMLRALTSWLYDGDPLAPLRFNAPLTALRARLAGGERVFESLIRSALLDQPHRTTVIVRPSASLQAERDAKEQARLAAAAAKLDAAAREQLVARTAELKARQIAPDDPALLAKMPRLKRKDLPAKNQLIPMNKRVFDGTRLLVHEVPSQGLVYIDIGFNLRTLPPELLPYVPLLGRALLETGTAQEDYVSLAQRIGSTAGGIRSQTHTAIVRGTNAGACWLFLRARMLAHRTGAVVDILRDVLATPRLDLVGRVRQIVQEEKAGLETSLVPSGHLFVGNRLRASMSEADWASEQMRGVSYLQFLRKLVRELETGGEAATASLKHTLELLLNRRTMLINLTGDAANVEPAERDLARLVADIPARPPRLPAWPLPTQIGPEGLAIPAQVNYVGKAANVFPEPGLFNGTALVVSRFLRTAYLWEHVRVQGGAYGAFCQLDPRSGLFSLVSYRDPNIQKTLDAYDGIGAYLASLDLAGEELDKAVIGAIGDMDQHLLPNAKGFVSALRYLTNEPDDYRQELRKQVLGTTVADFREFGSLLDILPESPHVVVMGAPEALQQHPDFTLTKVL